MTRRWVITGYDSQTETFSTTIAGNAASDDLIKRMIQTLAARHLNDIEVIEALNPVTQSTLLEVRADQGATRPTFMCGENPYYVAVLEQEF